MEHSIHHDPPSEVGRESVAEPVLRSRLLPRVSFRSMMLLMSISAVFFAVVYAADQGGVYSAAVAVGLFFAAAMMTFSAFVFLFAWAVSLLPRLVGASLVAIGLGLLLVRLIGISIGSAGFLQQTIWLLNFQIIGWFLLLFPIGRESDSDSDSPFAQDQLPPQIFAPRDPTNE
jgi:hypothetical protein